MGSIDSSIAPILDMLLSKSNMTVPKSYCDTVSQAGLQESNKKDHILYTGSDEYR